MSIGRLFGFQPDPSLIGHQVLLRAPEMRDHAEWARLREQSRAFLEPWEPLWPADDLTRAAFRHRLALISEERRRGEAYTFFLFRRNDNALMGGLTLGNIRYGVAQTATLGYWMGEAFAGQGYMRQGVELALDFAFNRLKLHRVEAACLPRNTRSFGLLTRLGFRQEGLARAYLEINGRWEDHLLFALLANDPRT
jgi:ribosomal-protein-alanine N-acetyltransferase